MDQRPQTVPLTTEELLQEWSEASGALSQLKDREAELRRAVVASYANQGKETGTQRVGLDDGWTLKIDLGLNYNVSTDRLREIQHLIPAELFIDLFRTKYELSITAYKKLTPAQREFINYALTITTAMPALELIEPTTDKVI